MLGTLLNLAVMEQRTADGIEIAKRAFAATKDADMLASFCSDLGDIYKRLRDYESAEQMYIAVTRYRPESAWARGNYANFLNARRRYTEAIEMAKSALALSNYGAGRKTLAEAYAGRAAEVAGVQKTDEAKKLIELAEKSWSSPNEEIETAKGLYFYNLGIVEKDVAHVETGKKHFQKALELDPDHWNAKRMLNGSQTVVAKIQSGR